MAVNTATRTFAERLKLLPMKSLILLLYCLTHTALLYCQVYDLYPYPLRAQLTAIHDTVSRDEIWPLRLALINTSDEEVRVITPHRQCSGQRLVYLAYYTVDSTNFYREVYRETRTVTIDSTTYCSTSSRAIAPHDTLTLPLYVGDKLNYGNHIQAHHERPDLPAGTYRVRAWYQPLEARDAAHFITTLEGTPHPSSGKRLIVPDEGTVTPPIALTIVDTLVDRPEASLCDADCGLCKAIAHQNWRKVRRIIDRQTYRKNGHTRTSPHKDWTAPHRRIDWVYPGPEAILASLPSYTGRSAIFRTNDGYAYYALSWQLGIVYGGRGRLRAITSWLLHTDVRIRTSTVDYVRLTYFEPY